MYFFFWVRRSEEPTAAGRVYDIFRSRLVNLGIARRAYPNSGWLASSVGYYTTIIESAVEEGPNRSLKSNLENSVLGIACKVRELHFGPLQ